MASAQLAARVCDRRAQVVGDLRPKLLFGLCVGGDGAGNDHVDCIEKAVEPAGPDFQGLVMVGYGVGQDDLDLARSYDPGHDAIKDRLDHFGFELGGAVVAKTFKAGTRVGMIAVEACHDGRGNVADGVRRTDENCIQNFGTCCDCHMNP